MKWGEYHYYVDQEDLDKIAGSCQDRHDNCPSFASGNGCESNPGWMIVNCARSCNDTQDPFRRDYCELQNVQKRCEPSYLNYTRTQALQPGDIETRFSTMIERFPQFEPKAVSKDPWIMQFDNFLSDAECDALYGTVGPFERSTDTGAKK
eukprot:UN27445